jgi:Fur family ferric uptake transcriptional regulator
LDDAEGISRATIFRTIGLFKECGFVRELEDSSGQRFCYLNSTNFEDPSHLICADCGSVMKFQDEHMALLEECITRRLGFKSIWKSMRIEASCEKMRIKGVSDRK